MGNGFQFFDIILFALIAGFIILRLRNVLGRRDGHEGGYRDSFLRQGQNQAKPRTDNVPTSSDHTQVETHVDDNCLAGSSEKDVAKGLSQIKLADPKFNEEQFIKGSSLAFKMIVSAFAAGDRKSLKQLLSPEVMANFEKAIDDRELRSETVEHELVDLQPPELVEASVFGNLVNITVKFVSKQTNIIKNANGEIIDENSNDLSTVTDFWTFQRDVRSRNPNWALITTYSAN